MITEGRAVIGNIENKVSKKLPVFYNPVMKFNRDISILLLNAIGKKMRIADPLAGSGVRAIRFVQELKTFDKIFVNDASETAVIAIKKNFKIK